jgi:hypothetical protein
MSDQLRAEVAALLKRVADHRRKADELETSLHALLGKLHEVEAQERAQTKTRKERRSAPRKRHRD